MIRFFDKAVQTGTGEDGLPVYAMVPYFEAYRSAATHVIRPARDADSRAYPKAWEAYKAGREPDHDGFPLAAWPQIDEAERKGLAERGIHTLEKLVEADMTNAPVEFRDAQAHAADFLENMRSEGPRLAARIDELQSDNEALKTELAEVKEALADAKATGADVQALEKSLHDATDDIADFGNEIARLQGDIASRDERIEALTKELAAAKTAKK